jgi:hypothetical protein
MKHPIIIRDRITDLIVTGIALGAVDYVCGVGLHGRIGDLTCRAIHNRHFDRANYD